MNNLNFDICRLYRPWVLGLFKSFPQRKHQIFKRISPKGYPVKDFEITPVSTPWLHLSYALGLLRCLVRLGKDRPDVVVAEETESACLGIMAKFLLGIPFVFDFVDDYAMIIKYNRQRARYHLAKWVERTAPRVADRVIVVDRRKLEFCRALGVPEERIVWIPNGYDPGMFSPGARDRNMAAALGIEAGQKVAAFVGKLNRYYNLEMMIRAIPEVHARYRDVVFLFVGEGDDTKRLEAMSRRLGLGPLVRFTGPFPHEEIPKIINLSDLCLFPLADESALILYEYMGCGKPVVVPRGGTAKMGISRQVFPDDCILRVEDSSAGFARGILYLLENPDAAGGIGLKACQRVAPLYSWDRLSEQYLETICDVMENAKLRQTP